MAYDAHLTCQRGMTSFHDTKRQKHVVLSRALPVIML